MYIIYTHTRHTTTLILHIHAIHIMQTSLNTPTTLTYHIYTYHLNIYIMCMCIHIHYIYTHIHIQTYTKASHTTYTNISHTRIYAHISHIYTQMHVTYTHIYSYTWNKWLILTREQKAHTLLGPGDLPCFWVVSLRICWGDCKSHLLSSVFHQGFYCLRLGLSWLTEWFDFFWQHGHSPTDIFPGKTC